MTGRPDGRRIALLATGHTLTSYPSLRTDTGNAGGQVVDEEVVDRGLDQPRSR